MTSGTATLVSQGNSPFELTSMFPRPRWENVEASLDRPCRPLGKTARPCWFVKGPAREAYMKICYPLRDLLYQRDDWREGAGNDMPYGFDCFMVGQVARGAAKARPTIIIHCRNVDCCHRAVKIVRHSELWIDFLKQYPAFKLMSRDRPPRPLARDFLQRGDVDSEQVYINSRLTSETFATPIFFKLDGVVGFRQATMGGMLSVGGEATGLTVVHALHATLLDDFAGASDDEVESFWSDTEEEGDDSSASEDDGGDDDDTESRTPGKTSRSNTALVFR